MCHGHRSREWSREETDESTDEPAEEPSLSEPEEATDVEILTDGAGE
ncbi:hypothetical protein [Halorubrum sp. ASP1]|nr:hypothetical protein [Halorubrum sp. ASP1]